RARTELIEQARAFVERQLALFAAGSTRELRERILRAARLSELDRRDFIRLRALVRDLAKKLASRYGRNRKRDRKGFSTPAGPCGATWPSTASRSARCG